MPLAHRGVVNLDSGKGASVKQLDASRKKRTHLLWPSQLETGSNT